jgi:hypothetical protein
MNKIITTPTFLAASFLTFAIIGSQLQAGSYALPFGDRTINLNVPSGCKLKKVEKENYACEFATNRNKLGGSFQEKTMIIVSGGPVSLDKVLKLSVGQSADLAKASQKYIQGTDHAYYKKSKETFINQYNRRNSQSVSKNAPFGGIDCKVYTSALITKVSENSLLGIEKYGKRCLVWSYPADGSGQPPQVSDVLVEVREYDDYHENTSRSYIKLAGKVIKSIKFK